MIQNGMTWHDQVWSSEILLRPVPTFSVGPKPQTQAAAISADGSVIFCLPKPNYEASISCCTFQAFDIETLQTSCSNQRIPFLGMFTKFFATIFALFKELIDTQITPEMISNPCTFCRSCRFQVAHALEQPMVEGSLAAAGNA